MFRLLSFALAVLVVAACPVQAAQKSHDVFAQCGSKDVSHADRVACAARELDKIHAQMEAEYRRLMADAKENEEQGKAGESVAYEGMPENLEKAKTAFDAYESAQCAYQVQIFGGGTMGMDADVACRINLETERLARLRDLPAAAAR
jgi:uncharacterized protein YecT (DUF1311 family)